MGLYNLVHGTNPASDWLLGLLNLTRTDVGRFRDAWVSKADDGRLEIAVYTRNGGGNRADYMPDFSAHPLYLRDEDDDFDCTYATIYFSAPVEALSLLAGLEENRDPSAEWAKALDALREGKREDPALQERARQGGEERG
jgi:hypothetical protein